jgi:hypothetical protein
MAEEDGGAAPRGGVVALGGGPPAQAGVGLTGSAPVRGSGAPIALRSCVTTRQETWRKRYA